MRDQLPTRKRKIECGILNLDDSNGPGTHWVAYYKYNNNAYYFDSFGNLPPPLELIKYLGNNTSIYYNYKKYQSFDSVICGQLSLKFLCNQSEKFNKKNKNIK